MKKVFKKISTSIFIVFMSFSLIFTNVSVTTYQAATVAPLYTSWELLVSIFSLLGITLYAAPELQDSASEDLIINFTEWCENHGYDLKPKKNGVFDPFLLLTGKKLTISQDDYLALQKFAAEKYHLELGDPINDINLSSSSSKSEFSKWLSDYCGNPTGVTEFNSFIEKVYDMYSANYSGIFVLQTISDKLYCHFFQLIPGRDFYFKETYDGSYICNLREGYGTCYAEYTYDFNGDNIYGSADTHICYELAFTLDGFPHYSSYSFQDYSLVINGQFYNLFSVLSLPVDNTSALDVGRIVDFKDYIRTTSNFSNNIMDVPYILNGNDVGNLIGDQNFDVIGGDRTWDPDTGTVTGDLTVTVPDSDVISDFSSGNITAEDMMNEMDVTPIDKSTGTDLLTGELIKTNTDILGGVNSILDILLNIWNYFCNFLDNLIQALLDMFLSLIIPGDGFIEGEITKIKDKFNCLGVVPYDMKYIFESDDHNPFQNITIDIKGQEVVIVSFDYLPPFLDKFRPVIRGLLVLFMIYYSINQLLGLIRLSGMMEGGNSNQLALQGSTVPQLEDKGGRR